jgi:hypothetical protein
VLLLLLLLKIFLKFKKWIRMTVIVVAAVDVLGVELI